jgi:hypothetical protein
MTRRTVRETLVKIVHVFQCRFGVQVDVSRGAVLNDNQVAISFE